MNLKLTKENSEDIGFVIACLTSEAISMDEFNKWVMSVIGNQSSYPDYFLELIDFNGPMFELIKILGFAPVWNSSEEEKKAIVGITYKRGFTPFEDSPNREEAESSLTKCPQISEKFKEIFPFLEL